MISSDATLVDAMEFVDLYLTEAGRVAERIWREEYVDGGHDPDRPPRIRTTFAGKQLVM